MEGIAKPLAVYFDRRMARILLLGIISGFPWVLIGSSLNLWLKEDGLSRTAIGWAGLIFAVYAVNFLWAPLIDRIRIPWLTSRIGHRRAWIVTLQAVILACLVAWSTVDPVANLAAVVAVGLVIAIASATQDITIDALRIEQIGTDEGASMAAGAATAVVGWWTGYKLGGAVALEVADGFQKAGVADYWQTTFLVLGVAVILCNIGLMFVREAPPTARVAAQAEEQRRVATRLGLANAPGAAGALAGAGAWFAATVGGPLLSFFRRNGFAIAAAVLGFIFLFKIGEAFLGRMSLVFYNEVGFSKTDIAIFSKGLGWVTTVTFTVLGGLFRDPDGPHPGHVPVRHRHGGDQSVVRGAGVDRSFRIAVRRRRGDGRPHQRVRNRDVRGVHLDAGGPDLHGHAIRAARFNRHGRADDLRGVVRDARRLARRRLGHLLRDHDTDGDPLVALPLGDPRQTSRHAGGCKRAPFR